MVAVAGPVCTVPAGQAPSSMQELAFWLVLRWPGAQGAQL
jgi:hypothetical protein